MQPEPQQSFHFVKCATIEHLVKAPIDPADESGTLRLDNEAGGRIAIDQRPAALCLPVQN